MLIAYGSLPALLLCASFLAIPFLDFLSRRLKPATVDIQTMRTRRNQPPYLA